MYSFSLLSRVLHYKKEIKEEYRKSKHQYSSIIQSEMDEVKVLECVKFVYTRMLPILCWADIMARSGAEIPVSCWLSSIHTSWPYSAQLKGPSSPFCLSANLLFLTKPSKCHNFI